MVQLVIVNGFPESGKSTFEQYCLQILGGYGTQISTVDCAKAVAKMFG